MVEPTRLEEWKVTIDLGLVRVYEDCFFSVETNATLVGHFFVLDIVSHCCQVPYAFFGGLDFHAWLTVSYG